MALPPDSDPQETREWLDALDSVFENEGVLRAHYLVGRLIRRARRKGAYLPYNANTAYVNTIPEASEVKSPCDAGLERRIRSIIRWSAMAMVVQANRVDPSLGGHISSFASAATLYDVGFNHFFRAPTDVFGGDLDRMAHIVVANAVNGVDLVVPVKIGIEAVHDHHHLVRRVATFEDTNLEAAIRSALSVGAREDLTCDLVSGLARLSAGEAGIESLVGIQNLTSLTDLRLFNNSITDISALSGLTGLSELYLENNPDVTDIQPLLDNTGLGADDLVLLQGTNVSCTDEVAALRAKGVLVVGVFCWVNPLSEGAHDRLSHSTFRSTSMDVEVGYVI